MKNTAQHFPFLHVSKWRQFNKGRKDRKSLLSLQNKKKIYERRQKIIECRLLKSIEK